MRSALLILLAVLLVGPSVALAEEEAEEEEAKSTEPRKPLPWEVPKDGEEACRPEEMVVLRQLRQRALEMDARERLVEQREAAAKQAEAAIAVDLRRVEEIRDEIAKMLGRADVASKENVASLAKMVDAMKAKEAAPMLAGMDDDVALEILQKLKPKQAAKILGAMDAKTAQRLGDRFTLVPDPRTTLSGGLVGGGVGGSD